MKQLCKSLTSFALLIVLLFSLSGCRFVDRRWNTPPSYSKVELSFERDKAELYLITDYMIESGVTDLYVYEDCSTALADLEEIEIDDETVVATLKRLKEKGYTEINKFGNTIQFQLWSGIRDISCGIAYLAEDGEIAIQYVTETEPLPENGWFYYVVNYNEWRSQKAAEASASCAP